MRFSVRVGRSRISGGPVFWLTAGPLILAGWMMALMLQLGLVVMIWCWRGVILLAGAWWRTNPLGRIVAAVRPGRRGAVDPNAQPVDLAQLPRRR